MRTVLAALTMVAASAWAAGGVAWGPAAGGLRLGVTLGTADRAGNLVLVFQNVGSAEFDVLLGGRTGIGPMYAFRFTAQDAQGSPHPVGYFGGANFVGGYLEPILVRLAAGETYELALPLKKFVSVLNRQDVTLDTLLERGYAMRAALEVTPESARWSKSNAAWRGSMQVWTGKVESADLRRP